MAKRPPTPPATSQAAVAAHFGVSERTVGGWMAAGCPGEPGNYDLAAIARWRREHKRRPREESQDDWGEKLKREKVRRARLERQRIERTLIDRNEGLRCWSILAKRLQQAGGKLQQGFGPAAVKILNAAIEDCRREVSAAFSSDDDPHNAGGDAD